VRYPGGKNASGTWQRIISQIPPHRVYCEPFVGSGAILRLKRPAEASVALDRDPEALADLAGVAPPNTRLVRGCGIAYLATTLTRRADSLADWFVYADPPYLPSTLRSRGRYVYMLTEAQHVELLALLNRWPGPVAISGYPSALYQRELADWRMITWPEITRGGYCLDQILWCNYPEPKKLHDARYVGADYRARENLARKKKRWAARIRRMPATERQALLEAIQEASADPARSSPAETPIAAATGENGGSRSSGSANGGGAGGGSRKRNARPGPV